MLRTTWLLLCKFAAVFLYLKIKLDTPVSLGCEIDETHQSIHPFWSHWIKVIRTDLLIVALSMECRICYARERVDCIVTDSMIFSAVCFCSLVGGAAVI